MEMERAQKKERERERVRGVRRREGGREERGTVERESV